MIENKVSIKMIEKTIKIKDKKMIFRNFLMKNHTKRATIRIKRDQIKMRKINLR